MNKLIAVFLIISLSSCISGCKKKDKCPEQSGNVSVPTGYSGYVETALALNKKSSGFDSLLNITGSFYSIPSKHFFGESDYIGKFLFNSRDVPFSPDIYQLDIDTGRFLNQITNPSFVTGDGGFTSNISPPKWLNALSKNLDSISLLNNFTINFFEFQNAKTLAVDIYSYGYSFSLSRFSSFNNVMITSQELSGIFPLNTKVTISVKASTADTITMSNNKKICVTKSAVYLFKSKIVN